jgi:ferredoxin--NADP+ reductase
MALMYDLIVVGAAPTGLSLAIDAQRSGLGQVRVLERSETATPLEAIGRYHLSVRFGVDVVRAEPIPGGGVVVETDSESFSARLAVFVDDPALTGLPIEVPPALVPRVHVGDAGTIDLNDQDLLIVGEGDPVVARAIESVERGARVVVAFTGRASALSPLARSTLLTMEHERRITILWRSELEQIIDVDGYPLAYWTDRHTPALLFDHVISVIPVPGTEPAEPTDESHPIVRVSSIAPPDHALGPARAWETIRKRFEERLPALRPIPPPPVGRSARRIEELRLDYYNATITHFDHSHEDLWVIRVRPDRLDATHKAGQYTTLGLGYWEPRVDDADEGLDDAKWASLIRRSYSISSRILDHQGYLVDPHEQDEIEFYIVHVRPGAGRIPALTPRLASKRAGDRIYLGPKVTGRYTLAPVDDPNLDVVFLATGTGEAPHNAMVTELFRKGHRGRIVSMVTVRHLRDLGYERTHRHLEERFPNYRYLALPTREPEVEKRYIQDVIRSGELAAILPHGLAPDRTHVFLCGNPAMIGLPERGADTYPESGVVGILAERGFVPDRRSVQGNVHYEEYW